MLRFFFATYQYVSYYVIIVGGDCVTVFNDIFKSFCLERKEILTERVFIYNRLELKIVFN